MHFPLVVFANAWLVGVERWMPSAANVAFTLGLDAAILAIAYGVASVTEHRTEVVRAWGRARIVGGDERRSEARTTKRLKPASAGEGVAGFRGVTPWDGVNLPEN